MRFLHVVSRWQLNATTISTDPLDPFFGEPSSYGLAAPLRGELMLHPSRVVRFLGNPLPDPLLYGSQPWSDSVLQSLYDAIHAVAVTGAGATSRAPSPPANSLRVRVTSIFIGMGSQGDAI